MEPILFGLFAALTACLLQAKLDPAGTSLAELAPAAGLVGLLVCALFRDWARQPFLALPLAVILGTALALFTWPAAVGLHWAWLLASAGPDAASQWANGAMLRAFIEAPPVLVVGILAAPALTLVCLVFRHAIALFLPERGTRPGKKREAAAPTDSGHREPPSPRFGRSEPRAASRP